VPAAERTVEVLMMGLRLARGIARADFRRRTGQTFEQALNVDAMDRLAGLGLIALDDNGLRASAAGRQRLNAVLAELVQ
jgi:coproporphyrinogen III oxidase-like Fe-S oxidoreductase